MRQCATTVSDIDLSRLLGREPVMPDMSAVKRLMRSRRVMVTGAAGSIGSELSRQLSRMGTELCLIDRAETPLHHLSLQVKALAVPADCTDRAQMDRLMQRFRPHMLFHAAAYKHVPLMERWPDAAVANNLGSTMLLADLCCQYGVGQFVMISTDKAVNPTNVMGASKRACELYVQSHPGPTRFVTTRFGNVLGSSGSVVPLFLGQLAAGGPLTVTHPDVVRFFMLIPEACSLVLLAAALGRGGEIFAFDMGRPVRIADLARRIIALWGKGHEKIKYTGLRPGEKLFEEVLTSDELTIAGPHEQIRCARVRPADFETVAAQCRELISLARQGNVESLVTLLKKAVPEYVSQNSPFAAYDR